MKYGNYLRDTMNDEWYDYYIQYNKLADYIKNNEKKNDIEFIELVSREYEKCNLFYLSKINEIVSDIDKNDDIKYQMYQISDLYQYCILNRVGFYKILKKT